MAETKGHHIRKDDPLAGYKSEILKLRNELKQVQAREAALQKQEHIFRDIFDTVGDGIVYTTLGGKVSFVNEALVKIIGIPKDQIVGRSVLSIAAELLHAQEAGKIIPLLRDIIAGKETKPFQVAYHDKILDVSANISSETRMITGIIRDITDRKKIEEELLKKNRDLSKLFMISLHLLESIEKKELLSKIVESAANLAGTDTSAIYLVKGEDLLLAATSPPLPDDYPDEFRKAKLVHHPHIQSAIKTRNAVVITDLSKVTLSKEEKIIAEAKNLCSLVYIPLIVRNVVDGVLILGTAGRKYVFDKHEIDLFNTYSNITSLALENSYLFENLKVNIEKAEESNRLKTAFLHNVSHEIRTPLNAIIGFSGLLGQPGLTPERHQEYNSIINQSNNQLLSIIEDILNISHIEAKQVLVSECPADLKVILNNLHAQFSPRAVAKGLEFVISNHLPEHDFMILTDENKLISILSNLLGNAFKFTQEGTVEMGCHLAGEQVEFYVEDTGIGIPEAEQSRIFERFYQVDKAVARLYGGMGLGLPISAAYVELLGGRIKLDSAPGKGSRFSFTIPCKRENSILPVTDEQPVFPADVKVKDKTILVAEDEDSNFAFIRAVLTPLGYRVLRAFNGLEALNLCYDNTDIALILMDIRMPVKDGYASACEIRKIWPDLPIVAQTAYGYPGDFHVAKEKGCVDYLTKPFSKDQLIELVKKHIKR